MKARLLYRDQDIDLTVGLPANHDDLAADLELPTLLDAMSGSDKFLREISERVLLTSLRELEAIRYRQEILADCVAEPEVIREIYRLAVSTLQESAAPGASCPRRTRHRSCPPRSASSKSSSPGSGGYARSRMTTAASSAQTG